MANKGNCEEILSGMESRTEVLESSQVSSSPLHPDEFCRRIVRNSSDLIWAVDIEGKHTFVNNAIKELMNYEVREVLGHSAFPQMYPEDQERVKKLFRTAVERKVGWKNIPIRWRSKDGELKYFESTAEPIEDASGNLLGFCGIDRDITERKKAQEALALSEARLRATIESLPFDFFAIDETGHYVMENTASTKHWGQLTGKRPAEMAPDSNAAAVWAANNRRALSGETVYGEVEYQIAGEKRHFYNIISPIYHNKKISGILGVNIDITERKQAEEALRKVRDELEQRVEERTRELEEATKQLLTHRRKLQALASKLSMAEERERRRIAGQVHDNIGQNLAFAKLKLKELQKTDMSPHCSGIIGDVLTVIDFIIQDTRSLVSEIGSPILYELGFVPAVEWLVKQTVQKHSLNVCFRNDSHTKPLREDVKVFLFQAVRELLVNVVKHSKATNCTVSLKAEGKKIRVDVHDDGIGFEPENINTPGVEGKGFGFFSIRERLEPLGGGLVIYSKPKEGTLITLFAPLAT